MQNSPVLIVNEIFIVYYRYRAFSVYTVIPPTLILHGTKNRLVNCEGSAILYRQLKKCGKDVQLYLIKGADHGGAEFWTKETLDIIGGFIQGCLKN